MKKLLKSILLQIKLKINRFPFLKNIIKTVMLPFPSLYKKLQNIKPTKKLPPFKFEDSKQIFLDIKEAIEVNKV
jgi:hypothetical protein